MKSLLRESSNSQSSYLPFRLNPSGIMPLIFSSGLLNVLIVGINKISLLQGLANFSNLIYTSGYFILTLFFSYFYNTAFALFINGNGGFIGTYLSDNIFKSLINFNEIIG